MTWLASQVQKSSNHVVMKHDNDSLDLCDRLIVAASLIHVKTETLLSDCNTIISDYQNMKTGVQL